MPVPENSEIDEAVPATGTPHRARTNTLLRKVAQNLSDLWEMVALMPSEETGATIAAKYESFDDVNRFTDEHKQKLEAIKSDKWLGTFTTLVALETAHPEPEDGSVAWVDAGVGEDVQVYIWDPSDSSYVLQQGSGTAETPSSIASKYEGLADVNRFDNDAKDKLDNIQPGAQVNPSAADIAATYNAEVPLMTQAEAEAGTATTRKGLTAALLKASILANAPGGGASLDFASVAEKPIPASADWILMFSDADGNLLRRSSIEKVLSNNSDDITQTALHEYEEYDGDLELLARQPLNGEASKRFGIAKVKTIGVRPPRLVSEVEDSFTNLDRVVLMNAAGGNTIWLEKDAYAAQKELELWSVGGGATTLKSRQGVTVNGLDNISAEVPANTPVRLVQGGNPNEWHAFNLSNIVENGAFVSPLRLWIAPDNTSGFVDKSSFGRTLSVLDSDGTEPILVTDQLLNTAAAVECRGSQNGVTWAHDENLKIGKQNACLRIRLMVKSGSSLSDWNKSLLGRHRCSRLTIDVNASNGEARWNIYFPDTNKDFRSYPRSWENDTTVQPDEIAELVIEKFEGVYYYFVNGVIVRTETELPDEIREGEGLWGLGQGLTGYIFEAQIIIAQQTSIYNGESYTPLVTAWGDLNA